MPKSSSKKKKEKNADFKKTKLKVGKKKAVADNFTDTSFKSKSISLPTQSISQDKTALLTNSRNVTFSELMTQLKHFSPGTRKDAILGLKDLFHRHPHLLPLHLGTLVNAIVRLLIDDSSVVRKALQTFLSEFIPMLHPRDIHPFLPLLLVYTCSAMTHILEDIREDALKFMDLWVTAGSQVVVNGFWDKIIPNYVSLLTSDSNASHASKLSNAMSFTAAAPSASQSSGNKGGAGPAKSGSSGFTGSAGSSTSKNALTSLKAKCSVLESLAGFLEAGLGSEGGGVEKDPYWFLRNFLGTEHARRSFNLARTTISGNEGVGRSGARRKAKKRKSSDPAGNGGGGEGRSVKKSKTGDKEEDDSSEDDDDPESDSDEEGGDEEDEEEEIDTQPEGDSALNMAPVVSLASAHRHRHVMATSPLHPIIPQSNIAQALFGDMNQSLLGSPSIPIRVFPQQGVTSAIGASASSSTSSSGNKTTSTSGGASTVQCRVAGVKQLISTIHPLLLSVWLDTAPNVFESSSTPHAGPALEITHVILRIWGILWRAALARPKTTAAASGSEDQEQQQAKQEEKWINEALQSMLKHVLIYFPFGKDSVGMMDAKVASTLHEMNTLCCELASLFLLASGAGKVQKISVSSLKQQKKTMGLEQQQQQSTKKRNGSLQQQAVKSSNRPSNKAAKQQTKKATMVIESSDDYDSEEEELMAQAGKDGTVYVQTDAPEWADVVVNFVLDTLGFVNPEQDGDDDDENEPKAQLTTQSSDFTPKHLVALMPTLWTLLNCLETKRREWVFEALIDVFEEAHHQSGIKKSILEFLSLIIKLQSHPHYTGTFTLMVPGVRAVTNNKALLSLRSSDKAIQEESIRKLSAMLSKSLLKLPKMLWDLGADRPQTSLAVLDLLAWIATVAGDEHAGAAYEDERVQFLKTLQNYMALFFSVTVGGKNGQETRLVLGPFSKLPAALQRRAVEIVYYSTPDVAKASAKTAPLMVAVQKCCQAADLSDETRLYIKETLCIE